MKVRVFSDKTGTSIYLNGRLAEYDIFVKSVWFIMILEKYDMIKYCETNISNIVNKYGGFSLVPSIHDFINDDLVNDSLFNFNVDVKSVKIDIDKKHPRLFSTLQKFLLKKYNIDFQ